MSEETPLQRAVRLAKEAESKVIKEDNPYKDMSYDQYVASKKKATEVSQPVSQNGSQISGGPLFTSQENIKEFQPIDQSENLPVEDPFTIQPKELQQKPVSLPITASPGFEDLDRVTSINEKIKNDQFKTYLQAQNTPQAKEMLDSMNKKDAEWEAKSPLMRMQSRYDVAGGKEAYDKQQSHLVKTINTQNKRINENAYQDAKYDDVGFGTDLEKTTARYLRGGLGQLIGSTGKTLTEPLSGAVNMARDAGSLLGDDVQPLYDANGNRTEYANNTHRVIDNLVLGLDGLADKSNAMIADETLPNSTGGRLVTSMAQIAPDIAAMVFAPEIQGADATGLLLKGKNLLWNPFTKYMMAKSGLSGYGEAKRSGGDVSDSILSAAKGVGEGGVTGATVGVLGGIAGTISKSVTHDLIRSGVIGLDNHLTKAGIRAMSEAVTFGGAPIIEAYAKSIATGEDVNRKDTFDAMVNGLGIGAAFGLKSAGKEYENSQNEYVNYKELIDDVLPKMQENAFGSFLRADNDIIGKTAVSVTDAGDLHAKGVELIAKSHKEPVESKRNEMLANAALNMKLADIKGVTEVVVNNKQELIDFIQDANLTPEAHDLAIRKINDIHDLLSETGETKRIADGKVTDAAQTTESLTDQLINATTPEEVSAVKTQAEQAVKQGIEGTQTLNETHTAEINAADDVSDVDFTNFKTSGIVDENLMASITEKVRAKEPLTEREIAVFYNDRSDMGNSDLENSIAPAKPLKQADPITFLNSNEEKVDGLVREILPDNKVIVATVEDGQYKEQTIDLPEEYRPKPVNNRKPAIVKEGPAISVDANHSHDNSAYLNQNENIQATGSNTITDSEQDIFSRNKKHVSERIKHEVTPQPTKSTKKINQIIKDVADGLEATLIYAKPEGSNSAGTYNPSNTLIKIKNAGDLDVSAHEIGHLIDDRYDLLGNKPYGTPLKGRIKDSIDNELKWYSDRGGSNPPSHLDTASKKHYLQREGFGEFIRAYIANPKEAKKVSPELFGYFEKTIDEKTKVELKKFSKDYIEFANSTAGDQVMANIEELEFKKPGIKEWLMSFSSSKDEFHVTPFDRINAQMVNSLTVANKAFRYILDNKSILDVLPDENFEMISRLFAGINGKVTRILDNGLVNAKNEFILSSDGNKMNLKWLFEGLDTTSEKKIKSEMDEVIKLLVAERTTEYATKFKRANDLTGVGGGIKDDLDVANQYLKNFSDLHKTDPDKYDRIKGSSERYRQYADAGLQYAVEKGRLSKEQYNEIKANNQYYVSLARVKEVSPTEEPLEFINKFAKGGITSAKDVFKTAKGGTGTIQNPYLSLIKNTTDIIHESDRNEVLRSFIKPLSELRRMGDGKPVNFASIARKVAPGEKNSKNIYVEGKKETWQFQNDIYEALTGMAGIAPNTILNTLSRPGDILRWSVTHSPFFAAKNIVRDTFSRTILSRSDSGIKDLVNGLKDKEVFDLFGGSQAGYFLLNKKAYASQLKSTIADLAKSKTSYVLDPQNIAKGWSWYEDVLSNGENINRLAEFRSAFKKAKDVGFDDYNAGLQAAFEARDTLDFAVAGHAMKIINRLIPFSNAGIQGLRRSALAAKEDPYGFALKMLIYTVMPQLAIRAIVHLMGDDEEYEQLPAYQRDLAYNFRTPFTGDKWVTIPKPFDLGLPSSFIDRMISKVMGNDHAFESFNKSMLSVLVPFDEGSIMGPFRPIVEGFMNKDTFRDSPIIPYWEEKRLLKNREGVKYASYISQNISKAMGLTGMETDPRYIDHFIKNQFSYYGDWTLSISDLILGNEDSRNKITLSKTGFIKDPAVSNAQVVKDVYKLASLLGVERSGAVKALSSRVKLYYTIQNEEKRRIMFDEIYAEAIRLRTYYEAKLQASKKKT